MLKRNTEETWQLLQSRPELRGFVLVGGSALALQIHHRESEDLDFAWPQPKLPQQQLRMLKLNLSETLFSSADDPLAVSEAEDCGQDLADFSQTYLVDNAVKVTFFAVEAAERQILSSHINQPLQLATLDEIFALKALVCAKRSKSRDWFDLYILMRNRGYTYRQFRGVFSKTGADRAYDAAAARLCSGHPSATDEGFASLMENPPSLQQMNDFFRAGRDAFEQEEAEMAFRKRRES